MMFAKLSHRQYLAIVPMVCLLSMLFALYVQHVEGMQPCPLCIAQRVAIIATGAFALLALCWNPKSMVSQLCIGISCLAAATGLAASLRHVYIQYFSQNSMSCGPGLEYWMETLPVADVLHHVFLGAGDCGKIDWYFLGLSMPVWVAVLFLAILVWLVASFRRKAS